MRSYSVNRRQVLIGAGVGAAGGFVGHHPVHSLTEGIDILDGTPDITVEEVLAEQTLKRPQLNETVPIITQIRNSEDSTQTVDVTLIATRDGEVTHRITKQLENIPPHKARPVTFQFEGPKMSLSETMTYDFQIQVTEANSDHQITKTGVMESISYNSLWRNIRTWASREVQLMKMGARWGDWGSVHKIPGTSTLSYFAGWLSASVTPGLEVAVDVRDCTVKNDAWWENTLDCGGAAFSVTATGLQITSAVGIVFPEPSTSVAGVIGLAYGKILDYSEDLATVAKVTGKFLKRNEELVNRVVRFLEKTFDTPYIRKVESKLDDLGFHRVARYIAKARGIALKVTNAKWTDKPVVLKNRTIVTSPGKGQTGHIKAYKDKYLSKEGIRKSLVNADMGWEKQLGQNGRKETIRLIVRKTSGGSYDIVKLYDEGAQWRVTNAWNNRSPDFLKNRKQKYGLNKPDAKQLHKSSPSESLRPPRSTSEKEQPIFRETPLYTGS